MKKNLLVQNPKGYILRPVAPPAADGLLIKMRFKKKYFLKHSLYKDILYTILKVGPGANLGDLQRNFLKSISQI